MAASSSSRITFSAARTPLDRQTGERIGILSEEGERRMLMEKTLPTSPSALFDDLLRLPVREPQATSIGIRTQGYAILLGERALLIDAVDELHQEVINDLIQRGTRPAALVLTHCHVAHYASVRTLHEDLGLPVLLHPLDAEDQDARASGVRFEDPMKSALLAELDVSVTHLPGHTPGHILLLWSGHGGTLFTGDCAIGPRPEERLAGGDTAMRPPFSFNADDDLLRQGWLSFDRPVAQILPLHGEPFIGRAVDPLLASLRQAERTPEFPPPTR
jgi:glyoxylase-like metal-dependent hydrolase (beta-lactamase superfamily II)